MSSVNKVILLGNLGADPELRHTASGTPVANMRLATSRRWNNKDGEWQEETQWHSVVAWGKTGELCCQYLSKGRKVYIEGRLQTRKWQDKDWQDKDGRDRYSTEVVADKVVFLGGGQQQGQMPPDLGDDDIPF